MRPPPIPPDDPERVRILRSLGILDTPPEPDLDELTRLAAHICGVPMALITMIDQDRQWFKAKVGIDGSETPREFSFCAHAIAEPEREVFVVPDAQQDQRFRDNPYVVGDPNVRFYAGAPLVTTDGWALGALCVVDRRPRQLTTEQLNALSLLRRHVVNAIELRRAVGQRDTMIADLEMTRRALDEARRVAEEATRAKADFLAAMSHEIRTPMNAVIGLTALLRTTTLTAEQKENVETIHASGEHLLSVINDILDYSKIEAGRVEIEKTAFEVAACVGAPMKLLAARATENHLKLRHEIDSSVPAFVTGDMTRVRQIVFNLLSNALKFTSRGEVVLRLSCRDLENGGLELQCSVRDTGIGISPEGMQRLFRNFGQASADTTRRFGGSGLGLAISKRLAELHGGRMWVESEVGRGSTFFFTVRVQPAALPVRSDHVVDVQAGFDPGFASRYPRRILVADDNAVNRMVARRTLEKLGYRPEVVSDGRQAVERLCAEDFDVVLMDIEMPDMDGVAATRAIRRELPSGRQPIIIALTAHALPNVAADFLEAGMDNCLTKPIRVAELTNLLARPRIAPAQTGEPQ